jgi:hypothetical protein
VVLSPIVILIRVLLIVVVNIGKIVKELVILQAITDVVNVMKKQSIPARGC